jgi:hypothetical protein
LQAPILSWNNASDSLPWQKQLDGRSVVARAGNFRSHAVAPTLASAARGNRRHYRFVDHDRRHWRRKAGLLNPIDPPTILGNTTFQGMMSLGMLFLLSLGWMDVQFFRGRCRADDGGGLNPWLAALWQSASALFWASSTACSQSVLNFLR